MINNHQKMGQHRGWQVVAQARGSQRRKGSSKRCHRGAKRVQNDVAEVQREAETCKETLERASESRKTH